MSGIRLWLLVIAMAIIALFIVAELRSSGRLTQFTSRIFDGGDLSRRAQRVNDAIDGALVTLGIERLESVREELGEDGAKRIAWEKSGRIPLGERLYRCNLEITNAVRSAGGEILRVRESDPDWRDLRTLDMRFGIEGVETHHLVLRESPRGAETPARQPTEEGPMIAIVIDDFGHNMSATTRGFLALDEPVTIAVLPHTPQAPAVAEAAHEAGKEVLVHLPMEPKGYPDVDPGDGALLLSQSTSEMGEMVRECISDVPYAVGANNHMGSRLTEDTSAMRSVMYVLKERGFFFVDSMTTPLSVARAEAARAGIPTARSSMFLDSTLDETGRRDVEGKLRALEELAKRKGVAIGICHPRQETLSALRRMLPGMRERGCRIVPVSRIVQ
jgi:polysaccharide deacetylase 2 family uncharacterized protein YibQ